MSSLDRADNTPTQDDLPVASLKAWERHNGSVKRIKSLLKVEAMRDTLRATQMPSTSVAPVANTCSVAPVANTSSVAPVAKTKSRIGKAIKTPAPVGDNTGSGHAAQSDSQSDKETIDDVKEYLQSSTENDVSTPEKTAMTP